MSVTETAIELFSEWYQGLTTYAASGGGSARGTIGAALVVLERLQQDYQLDLTSHRAPGGSQLQGVSAANVQRILAKFGEDRKFLREGGRTNRGTAVEITAMLDTLRRASLEGLPAEERAAVLEALQNFLTERVREYHNRQRLKVVFNRASSTWHVIRDLLEEARKTGREGQIAQHLAGAKLSLRFPEMTISNESYSTADVQLGRPGDFLVRSTAFHVTVSPMPGLYEKVKQNINEGYRVYLLVPDRVLVGARQNAEAAVPNRIAVESIESFVSQNIEELSEFHDGLIAASFRQLLDVYNERVDKAESDKSLMIEIPANLAT